MEIDAGAIEEGFQSVDWPCRMEVLRRNPLLMADGAHNPHSAARLVEAVKSLFPDRRVLLVVGISRNKDLEGLIEVLSLLSPAEVIATQSRHPRATRPDRLAHEFRLHAGRVRVADSVSEALDVALNTAGEGDLVLVTGSLFVAAEARECARGIAPETYPVFDAQAAPAPHSL